MSWVQGCCSCVSMRAEDERLGRKTKVLSVRLRDTNKAYVLDELHQTQVVNNKVAGMSIVLIASPNSDAVRVYKRKNH